MKKISLLCFLSIALLIGACSDASSSKPVQTDTSSAGTNAIDSAANNSILPPSGSPGNANNSSLADTTYKAKDTAKHH